MLPLLCIVALTAVSGTSPTTSPTTRQQARIDALTKHNSQMPEWYSIPPEGNGLIQDIDRQQTQSNMGGRSHTKNFHGGTDDVKDLFNYGQFGTEDNINMTPYVIQTKDQRWQAGVPNYEAPEEGYLVRTFDEEADARAWTKDKTGAALTINYPLAPDVDPEFNLANQNNPSDKNPNTLQDNVPTTPPKKQLGHLEPAYVGEYDEDAIFGDNIKGDDHVAGEEEAELQDSVYLQKKMLRGGRKLKHKFNKHH